MKKVLFIMNISSLFGFVVLCSINGFNAYGQQTFQKTYPDILNSKGIGLEIRNDTVFIAGSRGDGTPQDLFISALKLSGDELFSKNFTGVDNDAILDNQGFMSTSDNGFLVTGVTSSWSISTDKRDAFLMKLDSNLDTVWTKKYNNDANAWDIGYCSVETNSNNFILSYNSGVSSSRGTNLNEIDPSGNLLWNASYVSDDLYGGNYGHGLVQSGTGSLYSFGGASCDAFIRKHDSNGTLVWDRTFNTGGCSGLGGPGSSAFISGVYHNDTLYVAGQTPANGIDSTNVLLMKMDTLGNVLWSKSIGSTGHEYVRKMIITSNNELLLTGYTNSINYNDYDVFIYKCNLNGDTLSTVIFGGDFNEIIHDAEIYQDTLYLLGSKENTSGISEVLLIKTALDFNLCDIKNLVVSSVNVTYPLHPIANLTSGTIDINNSPFTVSSDYHCDSLICFTGTLGTIDIQTSCDSYTWIDGVTYYSNNNWAKDTLTNIFGCDSIVNLVLTIYSNPTPSITPIDEDLTTSTYNSYQWLYNGSELIGETNQIHTPVSNGNYQVIVWDSNGCSDTSAIFNVTGVGVDEHMFNNVRVRINDSFINIDYANQELSYVLYSVTGQLIREGKNETKISISDLTSGLYILSLSNKTDNKQYKIVVK